MVTSSSSPSLRRIDERDAACWLALRLDGLEESPTAFLATPEEDREAGIEQVRERLAVSTGDAFVIVAEIDGQMVGTVGVVRMKRTRVRHRALLWGMYVVPSARRLGLGRALVERALTTCRTEMPAVEFVDLGVHTQNIPALRLYESCGFVTWATEPDAFRVNGVPIDEHHMRVQVR